jgi:Zn finger protein HypA/HybF involved in hydrogenase expression
MNKYNPDNKTDFPDPVIRCDSCQKLIKRTDIHTLGKCRHCGSKKMRNVLVFSEDEMIMLKNWKIDPDFLALFEGVE